MLINTKKYHAKKVKKMQMLFVLVKKIIIILLLTKNEASTKKRRINRLCKPINFDNAFKPVFLIRNIMFKFKHTYYRKTGFSHFLKVIGD